jgi:PKD repeat protein
MLVKAGVEVDTISAGTSTGNGGTGSCTWQIPSTGATGNDYEVNVQSISQPAIKDANDIYFTISSKPSAPNTKTPPTAQFTANVTRGKVPLAVLFTDKSITTHRATYKWKFIDEDGIITNTSTAKNPSITCDKR